MATLLARDIRHYRTVALMRASWRDAELLRVSVLGWQPGPVPGDEDQAATHLVQRDDRGVTVAAVAYLPHPCPDQPNVAAVYLWAMAVAPENQGQGVGRCLLNEVLESAASDGAAIVWADARDSAVPFYERFGASVVGSPHADEVTGLQGRRISFSLPVDRT